MFTAGKDYVGVEANRAVVAFTRWRRAFSVTWTQPVVYPAPIRLDGLGIVVYCRDGVFCRNEPCGKAPK